jgi:hypothetical protein
MFLFHFSSLELVFVLFPQDYRHFLRKTCFYLICILLRCALFWHIMQHRMVIVYHTMLRNIPEEHRSHQHHIRHVKSLHSLVWVGLQCKMLPHVCCRVYTIWLLRARFCFLSYLKKQRVGLLYWGIIYFFCHTRFLSFWNGRLAQNCCR